MNIPALIFHFCDAIWEYRVSTNEIFLHYDSLTPEFCGQWLPYDTIDRLYQDSYVYSLDMELWHRFMTPTALQRFYNEDTKEEHFYIRLENAQKELEWHEIYVQRLGPDCLCLSSRDTREMQRTSIIAKAVVPEFDYVCCIDLKAGSYVLYYSDNNKTVVPQSTSDNYEKILEEFNRLYVIPEEASALTEQMRIANVQKELEGKKEYILYATMQDKDTLSYKKLRFSYENETKERLLLTRTDIGALVGERKLREREQAKRLEYLENMPVAFCSVKVLLDDSGQPYDFQFTYCNRAHEELEGVKAGELIGKNFYQFFKETDPKWLRYYYETAYEGISHVIRSYSPEIQKYLLIYTFRSEPGHCECVLLDMTEQHFLIQELEHSRETMKRILKTTTDRVFQYIPEQDKIVLDSTENTPLQTLTRNSLFQMLQKKELLHPDYFEKSDAAFSKIRNGEHTVSLVVQGRLHPESAWKWFQVTMFDFQDGYTHERKVFGFLKNIDEFRSREEVLRKKAEQDALTGVLNAGAGKQKISRMIANRQSSDTSSHAMFLMDLDDFKTVNDTMGHITGDRVLMEFARILRQTFHAEDVIYRLGGDEFIVFVEKLHDSNQILTAMLHRLMGHVREAKSEYPFLSCSIGVFVTDQQRSFEECYRMADQALYSAKRSGKGQFRIIIDGSDNEE